MPKTYGVLQHVEPKAVVIHCSDPRFQEAFRRFVANDLGLKEGEWIPIAVAGGGAALSRPMELPKEFKFMRERLELFKDHFGKTLTRIVIINHEDCAWYKDMSSSLLGALCKHVHVPREDMNLLTQVFKRVLAHLGLTLELYYAKFTDADKSQVTFEKV